MNDLCMPGTSDSACGNGGALCQDCLAMNGSCSAKTCVNQPQCNQISCPQGCCLNGACELGLSDQACGKGGVACKNCSAQGQICLDHFCIN